MKVRATQTQLIDVDIDAGEVNQILRVKLLGLIGLEKYGYNKVSREGVYLKDNKVYEWWEDRYGIESTFLRDATTLDIKVFDIMKELKL